MTLDVTYPLFPIVAFLGSILVLVPLPWHLQAWNSGTCFFMIWTSIACLNQFVNSIVWSGNALNPAPWWCEISIRILMGASVGIPISSMCIVRRLYKIANVQSVAMSHADKRRTFIIDALLCGLFPMIFIALQYVVQGHRYNIFEDIGCFPAVYNTLLTYFISLMWPVVIGIASAIYCGLALWEFNKRRIQFSQFLQSNGSLTLSRYFRLMGLALTEMCCTTPLAVFIIYLNATTTKIGPWRSWADTHFDYSRVEQIPAIIWRMNHQLVISMELTRWTAPFCAIVFFAFFGFAQEAKKNYQTIFAVVGKYVKLPNVIRRFIPSFRRRSQRGFILNSKSAKPTDELPIYIPMAKPQEKSSFSTTSNYASMYTSSDHASMTDISSKYETKTPLPSEPSPSFDSHAATPTSQTTQTSHDTSKIWNLASVIPAKNDQSDTSTRRFTM